LDAGDEVDNRNNSMVMQKSGLRDWGIILTHHIYLD
jgi:hypothetical protein